MKIERISKQLAASKGYLKTHPPDPLPLSREGGVWVREGAKPPL